MDRTARGGNKTGEQILSLEQLLAGIRGLDSAARSRVAQVLAETEVDARFEQLIHRLAKKVPVDDISDAEIQVEIDAVRRAPRLSSRRPPAVVKRV